MFFGISFESENTLHPSLKHSAITSFRVHTKKCMGTNITTTRFDQLHDFCVPLLFVYDNSVPEKELRAGLENVLQRFPIFAGTLQKHQNGVSLYCNNKGVLCSVVHKQEHLKKSATQWGTVSQERALFEWDDALLTIRVTYFSCGGMSIGVMWHHMVGDLKTIAQLMLAWSKSVAGEVCDPPFVVEDRFAYLKKNVVDCEQAPVTIRKMGSFERLRESRKSGVPVVFYFSEDELRQMKTQANRACVQTLSTNDALCAHFFTHLQSCDQVHLDNLSVVMDYRAKLGLPDALVGNIFTNLHIFHQPDKGVWQIAEDLREQITTYKENHVNVLKNIRFNLQVGFTGFVGFGAESLGPGLGVQRPLWIKVGGF